MYTYRITNEDGNIIVWIDLEGTPMMMQPHDPNSNLEVNSSWPSENSAIEWATQWIAEHPEDKI